MNKIRTYGSYRSYPCRRSLGAVAVLLSLAMALQAPAFTVLAAGQTSRPSYEDYRSGSAAGQQKGAVQYQTIEIATREELAELAENCSLDSWSADKLVKLTADIALQEECGISIPSFRGIFDGQNHRITGLRLEEAGSAQGLFRYLQEGGAVKNLTVEGRIAPQGSENRAGGIVGSNYGLIYNCSFSGTVEGDNEVGGIAGQNGASGEIRRCTSQAVVTGSHSVGGIAGSNHGTLNNCTNSGDINTFSTEITYDLEDLTLENFEDINSTANVSAHTDTGGIAGISDGKIYYCTNSGTVGYQHVGYNVGGIAGRLSQGYLQNCTNTGHVLGRKDVGGIAGQMEPFLEVQYMKDNLARLDEELDTAIDLLNRLHGDIRTYGGQASDLAEKVTVNLKNVSAAAGSLSGAGNDLWYLYNQELTGISNDLSILNDETKDLNDRNGESGKEENKEENKEEGGKENHSVSTSDIEDIRQDIKDHTSVSGGDGRDDQGKTSEDKGGITFPDNMEAYKAALEKFGTSSGRHLENMTAATWERTGTIAANLEILDKEMRSACDNLAQLADILEEAGDKAGEDMDALVEEARVLRKLMSGIRDDLFSYEGIAVKDTSDEAASDELTGLGSDLVGYDTFSFQKGKITLCLNQGQIEADTNVGGIVGQISTEFDFDPEDDITLSGAESFNMEQTLKAVVRECRNDGQVTVKKDCAGGVAGKADFGAVISCQSYGNVSSTGGSNVGGIAGSSSYAIRGCYSMGELSGKNNVGGIAGSGSDIFCSYAMNTLAVSGECGGSIAGSVKDSGTLYGNYYVTGSVGGVDGIGYEGGAAPLSYEEFSRLDNLPSLFTSFTLSFRADGEELAVFTCRYGDSLNREQIPQIPEKEGYYAVWPDYNFDCITSSRVLDAQYEKWVDSLASRETAEDGKTLLLAEGNFRPGASLTIIQDGGSFCFTIDESEGSFFDQNVRVRAYCQQDPGKYNVEVLTQGSYQKVENTVLGSYVVFEMERPGTFRLTMKEEAGYGKWVALAAVGVAEAAVVLIVLGILRRKKKMQHQNYSEQ